MTSEGLKAAIDLEQRGHDYYVGVAAGSDNPLTRAAFSALADEELRHMERAKQLYDESGAADSPAVPLGSVEEVVRAIFEQSDWSMRKTWRMDNAEAYDHAMGLERQSIDLYGRFAEETESSAEREFFNRLKHEELGHLSALQNVSNYLDHTGDWFASQENQVWNWMNM